MKKENLRKREHVPLNYQRQQQFKSREDWFSVLSFSLSSFSGQINIRWRWISEWGWISHANEFMRNNYKHFFVFRSRNSFSNYPVSRCISPNNFSLEIIRDSLFFLVHPGTFTRLANYSFCVNSLVKQKLIMNPWWWCSVCHSC